MKQTVFERANNMQQRQVQGRKGVEITPRGLPIRIWKQASREATTLDEKGRRGEQVSTSSLLTQKQ